MFWGYRGDNIVTGNNDSEKHFFGRFVARK
jgi:hypothetical protein